ncbi:Fic family protein [Klenkia sp. LSe6-5]|uniref:Fic family protein n=1 Tax=Klenkia sesuvii TaxID=3103137 RepID=A0ABU8DZ35_9ACTN
MAGWRDEHWPASDLTMIPQRERRSGHYRAYVPDPLGGRPLRVDPALADLASDAEKAVRSVATEPGATGLEGLSRFLLRSEAIASSLIEGVAPGAQQVALAELAQVEDLHGFSEQARLVANNITVLGDAAGRLAHAEHVTLPDIDALHRALLPDEKHHGIRRVQNWIGRSSYHPLDAAFVPPPPDLAPPMIDDLVQYMNGSIHAPLIQAALVHAQFETIHPFTDGNGRVGRALIHTVLTRRGLTSESVLPISLVLATLSDHYIGGLTSYRYDGPADTDAAHRGVDGWLRVFLEASIVAAEQARLVSTDVLQLTYEWDARVRSSRSDRGLRGAPRADSVSARLLARLPEAPVVTLSTVQRILDVSDVAARAGLDELTAAGVLTRKKLGANIVGFVAKEVFDVLGHAERQLASTQFDTRAIPPSRPVPARRDS